jgi:hypothetical protein
VIRDDYDEAYDHGFKHGIAAAGVAIVIGAVLAYWLTGCSSAPPVVEGPGDLRAPGGNPSAIRSLRACSGRYRPDWCRGD